MKSTDSIIPPDDIVIRLRKSAEDCIGEDRLDLSEQYQVEMDAAEEIERLRAELTSPKSVGIA